MDKGCCQQMYWIPFKISTPLIHHVNLHHPTQEESSFRMEFIRDHGLYCELPTKLFYSFSNIQFNQKLQCVFESWVRFPWDVLDKRF